MTDSVFEQGKRYPDLKERLSEFWMYSPCAEKKIPDDMREVVAWAWDEIVKCRDELKNNRQAREELALEMMTLKDLAECRMQDAEELRTQRDRLQVEVEAWRSGRLFYGFRKIHLSQDAFSAVDARGFNTIDEAVDALLAEIDGDGHE